MVSSPTHLSRIPLVEVAAVQLLVAWSAQLGCAQLLAHVHKAGITLLEHEHADQANLNEKRLSGGSGEP